MRILVIIIMLATFFSCEKNTAPPAEKITKEVISTPDAPAAIGPYSQAIRVGNRLYLAGQIALDPASGEMVEGIEAQTRRVLDNIKAVLDAADFSLSDVVQTQVFIADMNNYGIFNGIYAEYFPQNPPARAVVEVSRLPKDALVEVMMVAIKTDD